MTNLGSAPGAGQPSSGDGLDAGLEVDAFGNVHVVVAGEGCFPAAGSDGLDDLRGRGERDALPALIDGGVVDRLASAGGAGDNGASTSMSDLAHRGLSKVDEASSHV